MNTLPPRSTHVLVERTGDLDLVDAMQQALIDELADQVTHARTQLAETAQALSEREQSVAQLQRRVCNAYRAALRLYRTRNAATRSDPAHWEDTGAIVPIELAPLAADTAAPNAARATLTCAAHSDVLEAARLEIERSSSAAAQQIAARLARLEAVLYRDWFKPAEAFRARLPAVPLMTVREVRRASGVS